jgi:hypothetical protein
LVQYCDTTNHRTGNLFISNYTAGLSQAYVVGLQNASGTAGLQYRYLNPDGFAVSSGPLFDTLNRSMTFICGSNNTELDYSCQSLNLTFRLEAIQLTRKDTISVMLRMPFAPYALVEKQTVVYDTITGSAAVPFTFAENGSSYFIYVSHRNSISTWSANPVGCSDNTLNYDFTTGLSKAYENNMVMVGGKASFYTGDLDSLRNSVIDVTDIIAVYNENINFRSGPYLISDLNFDKTVDFSDVLFVHNNSGLFIKEKGPPGAAALPNNIK